MKEAGIENPTDDDARRLDRVRDKKTSNDEWVSPTDPDAKITRLKDGPHALGLQGREHRRHGDGRDPRGREALAAVLRAETGVVVGLAREHDDALGEGHAVVREERHADLGHRAEILPTTTPDGESVITRVERANVNVAAARDEDDDNDSGATVSADSIQEVVGDKGSHKASTIQRLADAGIRTYFPERKQRGQRRWRNHGRRATAIAVYQNRARLKSRKSKRLQRRRGEVFERTFAHLCETGGHRRTRLRGLENVQKRYLMQAAAFNLGLVMRQLLGHGTPRALAPPRSGSSRVISSALVIVWGALDTILGGALEKHASRSDIDGDLWPARLTHSSTGC